MSLKPKLSILIATLGRREQKFKSLLIQLMPQVEAQSGKIEVVACWNNGELPIGAIRSVLLKQAIGEYVCFIDDDDKVADDYCARLLEALRSKPDYVGFKVKLFNDGVEKPPVYHSISYGNWHEDERGYYRGVTHLNPIKRSIALLGHFDTGGAGEDARWAHSVTRFVKTEEYIDEFMYFYYHDRSDTSFGGDRKPHGNFERPSVKQKYLRVIYSEGKV